MKRRILSVLLVVCMVISMLATAALAAPTYVDIEGHWGEEAIEYWSAEGIVGGVGEGRFNPDGLLTRAEAAAILARLLQLSEKADISKYTDCVAGEWYYDSMAKCVAAGIMNGTGANTLSPGAYLSRAQMFTMFARATGIAGQSTIGKYFVDYNDTPAWAAEYVNALVNLGYVGGTSAITLEPNAIMTRASLVVLLRKTIAAYVTEGGKVEVNGSGIVLIVTNEPTQVSGNFTGTIVSTQSNATISLAGLTGKVEVIANADNTKVVNAPVGTTVTSSNGAQNTSVNNIPVGTNDSETVAPSTPVTPSVPSYPTYDCVHAKAYERPCSSPMPMGCKEIYCPTCDKVLQTSTCDLQWTEPTCTEKGIATCKVCGTHYPGFDKDPLGHTEVVDAAVAPTCTETGLTEGKHCSVCNEVIVAQTVVDALGHSDENGDYVCDVCDADLCTEHTSATREENRKEATCGADGSYDLVTYCSKCGEIISAEKKTIPATGEHEYVYTDKDNHTHDVTCANCDYTETGAKHEYVDDECVCGSFAKFALSVSSDYAVAGTKGTTTVGATVYNDYAIEIDVPGTHVNSDDVTIYAMMQNVAGLGVGDKREHSVDFNAGLGKTVALGDWMPLVMAFEKATVNVDVEGNKFVYDFKGTPVDGGDDDYDSNYIVATTDKAAASAAWQALTADTNIESGTGANDSKIVIANGSYLLVDSEMLEFETKNDLVLDNINDMDALEAQIRENVKLTSGLTDENKVVAFLAAGTELAVGSSYAKLLRDATIVIEGMDVSTVSKNSKAMTSTPLASIRDAGSTEIMVKNLVYLFDAIVGGMNDQTVNVTVSFSDPVEEEEPTPVEKNIKFQLAVSSEYGEGATTKVEATVYDDYVAELVVPGTPVSASNVTLYAMMQNVASLGVSSKREHSVTVNTGMTGVYDLESYLKNAVEFKNGTVNVSIEGANPFQYVLTGAPVAAGENTYASNVITATPSSTEGARAAWQALTSHVATGTGTDSKVVIANGSYMVVGTEMLCFETENDLVLDNFNNIDALKQNIKDNVTLANVADNGSVVMYLAAGTELAVGSSTATLEDNATIVISGVEMTDGILSEIRTAASGNTKVLVKELIDLVNEMVGAFDGKTVNVAITFSEPEAAVPAAKNVKFQLAVSSDYAEGKTTKVEATVYDNYVAELVFPGTPVSASNVTLYAMMENVGSLGVDSKREHSVTVNTGMTGVYDLESYLKNAVEFKNGTVNVSIEGANPFQYVLTGAPVAAGEETYASNVVTATPSSTEAARAAWQALTSHVVTGTGTDSKIVVANGSYMIVGTEKLCFETEGDLVLDNFNNIDALKQSIKDAVTLVTVADTGDVVIFLAAGTELAVGSSTATLKDDAIIVISGIEMTDGILSEIRTAASGNTKVLVKELIDLINEMVGGFDGKTVNVTITFA